MIIGLTGEIGVGKSFVASCFKKLGAAVFDADFVVHQLYKVDKSIINYVDKTFPGVVINDEIDRSVLSKYFLAYDKNWIEFEALVHCAVFQKLRFFLAQERKIGREFLILDIPLLLETKLHSYCDFIIFIHTNRLIQNQRLSKRNMDEKKLSLMCSTQLSLQLKRKLSNFTINANVNKGYVFSQVKEVLAVARISKFSISC